MGSATIHGEPWMGVIDLQNSFIRVNGHTITFRIAT